MPLGSIICRRKLDQERGNPMICECPKCQQAKNEGIESKPCVQDGTGREISSEDRVEVQGE